MPLANNLMAAILAVLRRRVRPAPWLPLPDPRCLRLAAKMFRRRPASFRFLLFLYPAIGLLEGGSMLLLALGVQVLMQPGGSTGPALQGIAQWVERWMGSLSSEQMGLVLMLLAMICQVGRSATQFLAEALNARMAIALGSELRRRLFGRSMARSFEQHAKEPLGQQKNQSDQIAGIVAALRSLSWLIMVVFKVIVFVGLLLWLSWPMTILAMFMSVLLFWPTVQIFRRIRESSRHNFAAQGAFLQRYLEFLQGFRLIHVFGLERHAAKQFDLALEQHAQTQRRTALLQSLTLPVLEISTFLAAGLFFLGGWLLARGQGEGLAAVISFNLILYRLVPLISQASNSLTPVMGCWPGFQSIAATLAESPPQQLSGNETMPALREGVEFRDVTFCYEKGSPPAVENLSFTIRPGQMTALVGPSGSGKSTVLNLLLRCYSPSAGAILVDGRSLANVAGAAWRAQIGVVDQEGFLFHGSVYENIILGKLDATRSEVEQAAQAAGVAEFIERLPAGYDTVIGERGLRLSGGQRQRLAIARALIRNPRLLVLDEATSSLDSQSEQFIWRSVERQCQVRTVVCVAHRLSTIVMADQILVLERGRLVERGTHRELLDAGGLYSHLWHLQQQESSLTGSENIRNSTASPPADAA
ncbi:MAG: ABC transporter ATP-binding protein [Planctomycetia bacterium]|nr:ABC transporter ATP-binding protein [Planctomycetia bacterium]